MPSGKRRSRRNRPGLSQGSSFGRVLTHGEYKMKKKRMIITSAAVLFGAISVASLSAFAAGPTGYKTETAGIADVAEEVEASGKVHGERTVSYYSSVSAPISEFDLKVGDQVKKGDPLAAFDLKDLEIGLETARLNAESSESNVEGSIAQSNANAARYSKALADEQTYMYLYAAVRSDSNNIDQDRYQAQWDLECLADSITRSIADKNEEIVSKQQDIYNETDPDRIDELRNDIYDLEEDVASMTGDLNALPSGNLDPERYARYVADSDWLNDITRNWTQATTRKNTYESQILNKDQVDSLKKAHEITELSAKKAGDDLEEAMAGIVAEEDGIVSGVFVDKGSVVTDGTRLFTIESIDRVKADVEISKYDIGKIKEGQKADVKLGGNTYSGRVTKVNRYADAVTSDDAKVTVSIEIDSPDDGVVLGLECDATIYTNETDNVVAIPIEGVYSDDEGDYCYLISGGIVEKRYFTAGVRSDSYVQVIDGVREGEVVISDSITDDAVGKKAVSK